MLNLIIILFDIYFIFQNNLFTKDNPILLNLKENPKIYSYRFNI